MWVINKGEVFIKQCQEPSANYAQVVISTNLNNNVAAYNTQITKARDLHTSIWRVDGNFFGSNA